MGYDAETSVDVRGTYLYGVADSGDSVSLGEIGIEGAEVYTIPYRDICAVVHTCESKPFQSGDDDTDRSWIITHHEVVDSVWGRWGAILPSGFNTIFKADETASAQENVRRWLEDGYETLKRNLERVRGRAEFGVQVFWDPRLIAQDITNANPEIRKLEAEIRSKPKGLAYMFRHRLENLLKQELEAKADQCFREHYGRIRKQVDEIRVEKTKRADAPFQMIMNLSCLVALDQQAKLGEELGKIDAIKGFSVRFTGPWPPYSFVGNT